MFSRSSCDGYDQRWLLMYQITNHGWCSGNVFVMAAILLDRHLQSVANYLILRWQHPEHSYHFIIILSSVANIWYWGGIYQNILIIVSITMVIVNINMISYIHHKCKKSHDQPRNLATIIWQILFSSLAVADLLVAILVMPLGAVKEVRSKYISDIVIRLRYRKYLCQRGGIKIYFQY